MAHRTASALARGALAPAQDRAAALPWWAVPPVVVGLILAYLGAHLLLRLALGPTLGLDDAEQALFAQAWSWGYRLQQPPLFTWLLLPLFDLIGVNLLALSLLRYGLLALTALLIYLVALRWIDDRRLAALAVYSFAAIYVFAYYAHHDLTHTTALGAMVAATLLAFAQLVERPSLGAYLLLGLCFGLGALAKWNFVLLPLGLVLACLLHPRFRDLILTWRTLAGGVLAALVVAPSVLWVLGQGRHLSSVSKDTLSAAGQPASFAGTLLDGTLALAEAALVFPQPFLVIFGLVFARPLLRALRAPRPPAPAAPVVTPAFLALLIGIILLLHWLLVPTLQAVAFTARWMHPALMILPVALFALLARGQPSARSIAVYLAILLVLVATVFGVRVVRATAGADACGKCRELVPFAALAEGLRATGFQGGTIVVPPEEFHIGGNLRVAFPDSRILDPAYPPSIWPAPGDGQCLAVWQEGRRGADEHRASTLAFLTGRLGVPADARQEPGRVDVAMPGSETRRYALGYALLPDGAGDCR